MDDEHSEPSAADRYYFCGCCGSLVPGTCPALEPVRDPDATACGQCGGPAPTGSMTVPLFSRYAEPVRWPMCAMCSVVGRGDFANATTLADVLASRLPQMPDLPLLAFELSVQPVVEDHLYPGVGWATFARRLAALGPYSRVRADARVADRPGPRWWHVPQLVLAQIVADLEQVRAAREPVRSPSGEPCCACGAELGRPGCWSVDALRRPVCGQCRDAAAGRVLLLEPPGIAQARALLASRVPAVVAGLQGGRDGG